MEKKIAFVNPFGTAIYDELIDETLTPYAATDTEVEVVHVEGAPQNIDYFWPKHLIETALFELIPRLEQQGFDAIIVGCCYDPGVRVARELVDIPVVGPLEAAMNMASYFGHSYTVVTDHHKAVPYLEDLVRLYGGSNCRSVRCINWWVTDMIRNSAAVAQDAVAECARAMNEDRSEAAILGCTIIGGCLEKHIRDTGEYADVPILNPNLLALKVAEALADLSLHGKYAISRRGYYQKQSEHQSQEFEEVRARYRLVETEPEHA